MIYLDNAASSWPKPDRVGEEMMRCLQEYGANPGRGSHRIGQTASRALFKVRRSLSKFFGADGPENFIFTQNATEALNLAIKGYLKPGDHVITTYFEHNSVRRPLEFMKNQGVEVTYVSMDENYEIPLEKIIAAKKNNTKLVVVSHASNVTGSLVDLKPIGKWTREHAIRFLVDASQTAGVFPIHIEDSYIDMLAVTGHKGLLGPQGTGFLYLSPNVDLIPLMHGGTGGSSELIDQPPDRPERYESGTRNVVGIVGMGAGLSYIEEKGIDSIADQESKLTSILINELQTIKRIELIGPKSNRKRAPIISFNVDGMEASEVGFLLDKQFDIAVRTGLHCAPLAHENLGTNGTGAVRVSHGCFTTEIEIEEFIEAMREIVNI